MEGNDDDVLLFGGLVSSKICHDLINSITAVSNGIELISDSNNKNKADLAENSLFYNALRLIHNSADVASARIQIYRVAFGHSVPGNTFAPETAFSLVNRLGEVMGEHAPSFEGRSNSSSIERDYIKIFLNIILIGFECLVRGGKIKGSINQKSASVSMKIKMEADKLVMNENSIKILTLGASKDESKDGQDISNLAPREVGYFLCYSLIKKYSGKINVDLKPKELAIELSLP